MKKMNPYDILGLKPDATDDEIKKAYRSMAKKYHPDKNKSADSENKFKEINEAYSILTGKSNNQHDYANPNVHDIFSHFMNSAHRDFRSQPMKGRDYKYVKYCSLYEFIKGADIIIDEKRIEICDSCNGMGLFLSDASCSTCGGKGVLNQSIKRGPAVFYQQTMCNDCNGTGKKIKSICSKCKGKGEVQIELKSTYRLPDMYNPGDIMSYTGRGSAGKNGGPNGNVYIKYMLDMSRFTDLDNDLLNKIKEI
jgi:molecular chaperone DnaJ